MSSPDQSEPRQETPYFTHEDLLNTLNDHVQGVILSPTEILEGSISRKADAPRRLDPFDPRTYDETPVKKFMVSVNPNQDREAFRRALLRQIFRVRMESRGPGLRSLLDFQAEIDRIEEEIDVYYEADKDFIDMIIELHFPGDRS